MDNAVCKSWQDDLKRLFFLLPIIALSFSIDFTDTGAVYVAVFIQGFSNIDVFWSIAKESNDLSRPTKGLVVGILITSFLVMLFSFLRCYKEEIIWMDCLLVKLAFIFIVSLPIIFWSRDFWVNYKNNIKEA